MQKKDIPMNFINHVAQHLDAYSEQEDTGSFIKEAAENDVTYNDMVALNNLLNGDAATGENIIQPNGEIADSRINVAIMGYEKIASQSITQNELLQELNQVGLTGEDFDIVAGLIEKQASDRLEAEFMSRMDGIHGGLMTANIDPMEAVHFMDSFAQAENNEEQDKVASEYPHYSEADLEAIAIAKVSLDELSDTGATEPMHYFLAASQREV